MSEKEKNQNDTKKMFIENVQQWVAIDTQLKMIHEKTKTIRSKKNELLKNINDYVQNHELQNSRIEISDGELRFYEKKEYSPLTYTYLEKCLGEIIPDKKQIEYIMQYLREHREIKTCQDIRRNYRNKSLSFS
jgi:hypothetical protein